MSEDLVAPRKPAKTTIVHIVGTMRDGGAEALIRAFVPPLAAEPDLDLHFLSIYDSRLTESERAGLGAPLHEIGRRSRADLTFAPRLVAALRGLHPTIVHAHSHSGKFAGRMAAIASGVPNIVFSEHGDESRGAVHWSINRLLNARTARFIVFTEDERKLYAAQQGIPLARVQVIANGIPAPAPVDVAATRHELGLRDGDFAIAMTARLVPQKNHGLALRAIAALRAAGRRRIRLFIIGEGPEAVAIQSLARELDLLETISFLGFRRDAQRLTAACDILAIASHWEKMPLVLGEAMMSGVPVVTTPWTPVNTFIRDGETGYISADASVEAFASALARPIDDPATRQAISVRGKAIAAERFSLARTVRSHAKLYRELAAATQPSKTTQQLHSV